MLLKFYKTLFILLVLLSFSSCNKIKPNTFILNGNIEGNYSGYIYLNYNAIKDSCLVTNNSFRFEGKIPSMTSAMIGTHGRTSAMERDFFIEEGELFITIEIQNKKIRETELDWIVFKSIKGSKTADLQKEYENYQAKFEKDKNWQSKKYSKINQIVSENPKNKYSASLLLSESWNPDANILKLRKMYEKLDVTHQDTSSINILKSNLYPEEISMVGNPISDFELPNENGKLLQTKNYRGKILFVDFWASWCEPCRKQMPEINKIYEQFKNQNFKILAVSLDAEKDKQKWLKAIIKEKSIWDNVIETGGFNGKVAKMYNIQSIPSNILVDEKGIIIEQNISPEHLKKYLVKNFVQK
jgi:peroxiredoxin